MPEPTTAPVTAEDLRERLADVVARWALMYPLGNWGIWGTADGASRDQLAGIAEDIAAGWGRDIADRVLAALAGDPGDLPTRMAEAIRSAAHMCEGEGCRCDDDEPIRGTLGRAEYVVEVEATPEDLAGVAMSARWEHTAAQAAEVERLRAIITSLDCATAERDAAVRRRDQAENRASLYRAQVADLKTEWDRAEAEAERLRAELAGMRDLFKAANTVAGTRTDERDAVVAAVRTAQITHIREWHPNYAHVGACAGCQVLVPLSRDLPSRPDDPDEIRRLMQATTEETDDG